MRHQFAFSVLVFSFIWFKGSATSVTTHQILVVRQKQNYSNSSGTNLGDRPHAGKDTLRWAEGKLNFTVLEVSGHSLIRYETVSAFCDFIKSNAVSSIISLDRQSHPNLIDIFTKYSGIPLIKGFDSDDQEFVTSKQGSSNILHLQPNPKSRLEAIFQLLNNYEWNHKVTVISQKEDIHHTNMANRLMTMLRGRKQSMSNDAGIFLNLTINKDDEVLKLSHIHTLLTLQMEAIVIFMEEDEAVDLLGVAQRNGFMGLNTAWILGHSLVGFRNLILPLAGKVVEIRLARHQIGNLSFPKRDEVLEDSLAILEETLKNFIMEGKVISAPPKGCNSTKMWESGNELYDAMKHVQTSGRTGMIKFDSNGFRTDIAYEVHYWIAERNGSDNRTDVIGHYRNNTLTIEHAGWPPVIQEDMLMRKLSDGEALNVAVMLQEPFVTKSYANDNKEYGCGLGLPCTGMDGRHSCCSGFCIDLLKLLMKDIGFSVRIHEVKDGQYGALNYTTSQWSGLIGEVLRGEADIAGCDVTINEQRSKFVDFTHPILETGLSVMVKSSVMERSNWTGFLCPFSVLLWIGLIIVVNVTVFLMWSLERLSLCGQRERRKNYEDCNDPFSFVDAIWFTWSLVLPSFDIGNKPRTFACRVVALLFASGMLIVVTSYTANLAAFLVIEEEVLPLNQNGIRDIKLQNPPKGFKIATLQDSSSERFFQATEDPLLRRVWYHMKHNSVKSFSEAIQKLKSGELQAYVGEYRLQKYSAANSPDCSLKIVGKSIFESGYGLVVKKNSSLTQKISNALLRYESHDVTGKLQKRWFAGRCGEMQYGESSGTSKELALNNFAGPFLVVCGGIIISIIFQIFKSDKTVM